MPSVAEVSETDDRSFFDGPKYYLSLGAPAAETGVLIPAGTARYFRERFPVRPWFRPAEASLRISVSLEIFKEG